ncbi:unnamed protein product, partial [Phaeothamnion confervicola]
HAKEVLDTIATLPENFTSTQVRDMMKSLERDIRLLNERTPKPSVQQKELMLHKKHVILATAYPLLFHRSIRGAIDETMLDRLFALKTLKDSGKVNDERARELVIDSAKEAIERGDK